jgi:hypothetical protein
VSGGTIVGSQFEVYAPLERVTIVTPLGIRFWDALLDAPVRDGLDVTARPLGQRAGGTAAFRTASGIYAFRGLPGLHDVEYPAGDALASPLPGRRFVVEVADRQRRFLPAVFGVDLPYSGIFPTGTLGASVPGRPPGFYLFSAPTRPVTPAAAAVRATLVDLDGAPAAYAVLTVQAPGGATWYGLADERGCAAVLFPYPTFTAGAGLASPLADTRQRWPVSVRVYYAPATLETPPGSALPDLRSILSQPAAVIWATPVGQALDHLPLELVFGQELVLRTGDSATLIAGPASPL